MGSHADDEGEIGVGGGAGALREGGGVRHGDDGGRALGRNLPDCGGGVRGRGSRAAAGALRAADVPDESVCAGRPRAFAGVSAGARAAARGGDAAVLRLRGGGCAAGGPQCGVRPADAPERVREVRAAVFGGRAGDVRHAVAFPAPAARFGEPPIGDAGGGVGAFHPQYA